MRHEKNRDSLSGKVRRQPPGVHCYWPFRHRRLRVAIIGLMIALIQVPDSAFGNSKRIEERGRNPTVEIDFERGVPNPFTQGVARGTLAMETSPGNVHGGNYALEHVSIDGNSYTQPWWGTLLTTYRRNGELSPRDHTFRLTIWAKASVASSRIRLYLFCLDESMSTSAEYWSSVAYQAGTEWQEYSHVHTCPGDMSAVSVRLDNKDAGRTVWWDDLKLEPVNVRFAAPRSRLIGNSEVLGLGVLPPECDGELVFAPPAYATNPRVVGVDGPVQIEMGSMGSVQIEGEDAYYCSVQVDEQALQEFEQRLPAEYLVRGVPFRLRLEVDLENGSMPFYVTGVFRGYRGLGRAPITGSMPLTPAGRYFAADGEAIYLTGSHTWNYFQEWGPTIFATDDFLDMMSENDHNFMRLWAWENPKIGESVTETTNIHPLPWAKDGNDYDLYDGDPHSNFDFDKVLVDPAYLDELECKVAKAAQHGIYVGVMLFQGWSVNDNRFGCCPWDPWTSHPFNAGNNHENVDGSLTGPDGEASHMVDYDLADPPPPGREDEKLLADFQKAYIMELVDRLQGTGNVLWEVSNEDNASALQWQFDVADFIVDYQEAMMYPDHPVGITAILNVPNQTLHNAASGAWMSPHGNHGGLAGGSADWATNPPHSLGGKVVITDSDHIGGILESNDKGQFRQWVWKNLTRGLNPIIMDAFDAQGGDDGRVWPPFSNGVDPGNPGRLEGRKYLGHARRAADRMSLAAVVPQPRGSTSPSMTGYCLYDPAGREYLVYQPDFQSSSATGFSVALQGSYFVEWLNPRTGLSFGDPEIRFYSGSGNFTSLMGCSGSDDYRCDAVLYLLRNDAARADLIVQNLELISNPFAADVIFSVDFEVENIGQTNSMPSVARYYLSTDSVLSAGDLTLSQDSIAGIDPGGAALVNSEVTIPEGSFGSFWVLVEVDADDVVDESNEGNNIAAEEIFIPGGAGPDLACIPPEGPPQAQVGESVGLGCDVFNIGDEDAAASTLGFYLSPNPTLSAGDLFLGEVGILSLVPGTYDWKGLTITVPAVTPGDWYWIHVVDDGDVVAESNELNNTTATLVDIQ